jgi:hypothetical protein
MRQLSLIVPLLLVVHVAHADPGSAAAARALFDPHASHEDLERFARSHYLPALHEHGDRIVTAPMRSTDRLPPGWNWVLNEPAARLRLCQVLADDLDTTDESDAIQAGCQLAALRAAGERLDTARAADVQSWIARDLAGDEDHPHRQAALAVLARNARLADTMKARARATERAMVRRSGRRVLFGLVAPDAWQPFRPTTDPAPACASLAFLAVPPQVRARDGFDLSVSVGGDSCHGEVVFGAAERELPEICGDDQVLQPGENEVRVTLSRNVNRLAGRRWDPRTRRNVAYHANTAGKRLASATWRCTMPAE